MKRLLLLATVVLAIIVIVFSLYASASDSRSLDDRVYPQGGVLLDPAVVGSWSFAEYQAKRVDRLLIILAHIREGRQSEALRMLEEDLRAEAKSLDADVVKLEKGERMPYEWDRSARDRVQEVSRRIREYERKYFPIKEQDPAR